MECTAPIKISIPKAGKRHMTYQPTSIAMRAFNERCYRSPVTIVA